MAEEGFGLGLADPCCLLMGEVAGILLRTQAALPSAACPRSPASTCSGRGPPAGPFSLSEGSREAAQVETQAFDEALEKHWNDSEAVTLASH